MYSQEKIASLIKAYPLLKHVIDLNPATWINPNRKRMQDIPKFSIQKSDMYKAAKLWQRFAPYFKVAFPETAITNGTLKSPLLQIPKMQNSLSRDGSSISGKLFLKCDNALPIAGSIKARGGFFEVLQHAENIALKDGILKNYGDYSIFHSTPFHDLFSSYKLGVGSTGNLGLSIGILGSKLGFQVKVYMSGDAKRWKKQLLRESGAEVIEFKGDFSVAIQAGREETNSNPKAYFVDDEDSKALYLGYTTGALELSKQLKELNIRVDKEQPLFVYLPCGIGGSPGGTSFGLKQIYGDNVHCFFVEPTHSPAVLTGLLTGLLNDISVQDIGIDNLTEADGLAVGRPSKFATSISNYVISGIYTLEDDELFKLVTKLKDAENLFLEPSATAGLIGPQRIAITDYANDNSIDMSKVTHIAWATGGDLVPASERDKFYSRGKVLLKN